MQKLLRLFSIFLLVAAVGVSIILGHIIWKGDPEIECFLDTPSIIDRPGSSAQTATNAKILSPLVTQSIEFALRLNPPQMPILDIPDNTDKAATIADNNSNQPTNEQVVFDPQPPISETMKFKLVGTVVCIDRPEKSLALMQLSDGQMKWFSRGENLGRFYIDNIHDGKAIMTRGNEKSELSVPLKPHVRALLKDS